MGKLNLEKISVSDYKQKVLASEIDLRTIYWLNDGTIYVGNNLYGGKVEIIESDPDYPEMNTIYVDKNTLSMKIYNGVAFDTINKGYTILVEDTSTDELVPTAKAVASYVQNKIQAIAESGIGVTSISYAGDGELSVTKDGASSNIALNGMTYSPTYDETARKLTIPIVGSSALEINFAKDTAVTAGKYNEDTNEIWLTLAEDKTYTDESKLIKIPAQGLIDVYTGKETNTATTTVSETNEISVNVKVSAESGNSLSVKDDGLYVSVPSDANKLDKVATGHVNEIITANADGTIKVSGKSVGGATLVPTPDENTVATEAAVKAYADTVANEALNNAKTYSDSGDTSTLNSAKEYADSLITWINW